MAPNKNYTPQQMQHAIEAVRNGGKIATTAKKFGVPRITLYDKISGKTPTDCTMGPKTVLSKVEETVLVKWIIALSERHFPITKAFLLESVHKIVIEQQRPNPFTENKPGKKWFQAFLRRHPEIVQKTAQNITKARDSVKEEDIRRWFIEIEKYLTENGLKEVLKEPSRIFNADESAFFLSPKPGRVLAKRGDNNLYSSGGDEKDNLSVLITGNANGSLAPPMIVFNYDRIPSHISASVPKDWAIGKSESGWMCSSTFFEYVTNVFNPWLEQQNIKKPILFFLDGHKSHLTLHLSTFCSENGIEVFALYPNSTHILQPMDLAVFRPLKLAWKNEVMKWKMQHFGEIFTKQYFAPVLEKALSSISSDCIRNGFRAGGLHPFGPDYIDMGKIKDRQAPEISTNNTRQADFLKYLESEIIDILSLEKLNFFNSLFYENRDSLENLLPSEDMALYLIWAKNKQLYLAQNVDNRITLASILPDSNHIISSVIEKPNQCASPGTPNAGKVVESLDPATITELIPLSAFGDISNNEVVEPIENTIITGFKYTLKNPSPSGSKEHNSNISSELTLFTSTRDSDSYSDVPSTGYFNNPIASTISPADTFSAPRKEQAYNTAVLDEQTTSLGLLASNLNNKNKETSIHISDKTPNKNNLNTKLGIIIPSPFKKHLFWPEVNSNSKPSKKNKKEKVPSTVTSKDWQEYHKKKELEKQRQIEEKERRAKERLEKKALKLKNIQEKKIKAKKRKDRNNESSSETDTDSKVTYAESGESELDFSEEVEIRNIINSEKKEHRFKSVRDTKRRKTQVTQPSKENSRTDSENESKLVRNKSRPSQMKIGSYVIVTYEGEFFPGKIEEIDGDQFEISTMILSTGNSFRWPVMIDKIWYKKNDIIEAIKEPMPLNKRGFYKIKEMEKYLPDVYDYIS